MDAPFKFLNTPLVDYCCSCDRLGRSINTVQWSLIQFDSLCFVFVSLLKCFVCYIHTVIIYRLRLFVGSSFVFEVCCASFFASRALYILYRFIGDSVNKDEKD